MFKTTLDIQEASSCNELSFILIVASVSTLKTDIKMMMMMNSFIVITWLPAANFFN